MELHVACSTVAHSIHVASILYKCNVSRELPIRVTVRGGGCVTSVFHALWSMKCYSHVSCTMTLTDIHACKMYVILNVGVIQVILYC